VAVAQHIDVAEARRVARDVIAPGAAWLSSCHNNITFVGSVLLLPRLVLREIGKAAIQQRQYRRKNGIKAKYIYHI
jgi:hypothetical protein